MGFFDTIERLSDDPEQTDWQPETIIPSTSRDEEATGPGRLESHPDPDLQVTETVCSYETGEDPLFFSTQDYRITSRERENFVAAWPWIHNHMSELLASGWTRESLLQCSKIRYPLGKWGVAWYLVWKKENLAVEIGRRGGIIFTFQSCGRAITQTAYPPAKNTPLPTYSKYIQANNPSFSSHYA